MFLNFELQCSLLILANVLVISSESTTETTVKDSVKVEDTPDEFEISKPKDTKDPAYTSFLNELYKKDTAKAAKRSVREAPVTTSKNAIHVEDTPDEFEILKPSKIVDQKYTDFIDQLYKADKVKETSVKVRRNADSPTAELPGQFDFSKPPKSEATNDFFSTLYKHDKVLLSSQAARVARQADPSQIVQSYPEDAFKRLIRSKRMVVFRPLFV